MPIFQTSLVSLMNQRLQYLSKRSQVLTENISQADVFGAKRKELLSFKKLLDKEKLTKKDLTKKDLTNAYSLKIGKSDIIMQKQNIEKELEVLELSHNVLNQQAIVDILSVVKKLLKTATNRS